MTTFPLITHPHADSIFAWRDGRAVSAARFLADVRALHDRLPTGRHMLNACGDRYRFTVGLAAAIIAGKISLLPSGQAPETIRRMAEFAPDAFCLTDSPACVIALPQLHFPALDADDEAIATFTVPHIDATQTVAYVFTSGSTGVPVPHLKTWGALVRNVRAEARLCGLDDGRSHALIGTVPPQHMYGFESTVLLAMQSANALVSCASFYPADICHAVAVTPRPRVLISTPVHLRSVVQSAATIPHADLVMSATAPLSQMLANTLESRFAAPLIEIYGSTETGQIAMRNPTRQEEWQLFPDIEFTRRDDGAVWAAGGHVERSVPMHDVIEPLEPAHEGRFLLHGRTADLVNIAGKRNSLANLNLQLAAIPGVIDGAFYLPDDAAPDEATRLMVFVVAPGLNPQALLAALRERIDVVFLPRPLVFVDALPRNATGKLPLDALKRLAHAHAKRLVPGEVG